MSDGLTQNSCVRIMEFSFWMSGACFRGRLGHIYSHEDPKTAKRTFIKA